MINKKGVWFLTLFSLILVLSVYYITMPLELLITNKKMNKDSSPSTPVAKVEESSILVALRVESDEMMEEEISTLKKNYCLFYIQRNVLDCGFLCRYIIPHSQLLPMLSECSVAPPLCSRSGPNIPQIVPVTFL